MSDIDVEARIALARTGENRKDISLSLEVLVRELSEKLSTATKERDSANAKILEMLEIHENTEWLNFHGLNGIVFDAGGWDCLDDEADLFSESLNEAILEGVEFILEKMSVKLKSIAEGR